MFKPVIDDRYSSDQVVSHGGASIQSIVVKSGADVLKVLSEMEEQPHVVAVDEAFMIPGVAETLVYLYKLGITVIVSTLDMSATGKPFGEPQMMMPWATRVEKLTSVCTVCGANAHYTYKKTMGGNEIEVGSYETYEPRCFSHNTVINKKPIFQDV